MFNEIHKRIFSSLVLLILTFYCIIKGSYFFNALLLIICSISLFEWHKMSKNKSYYFLGILYLIFSLYCVYQLRFDFKNGYLFFLLVTIICILTDLGGFIFGKIFKGPKLIRYSPNKTYSGMLGSFFLALGIVPLNLVFTFINDISITRLLIFTFLISGISQFGDILISYFKRVSKIKDTGAIIPGHGGLLDRIDGMIFAFPTSYLMILLNFFGTYK